VGGRRFRIEPETRHARLDRGNIGSGPQLRCEPGAAAYVETHRWQVEHIQKGLREAAVEKILSVFDALQRHPDMGRKGRVAGTRELILSPYVIAYCVKKGVIKALASKCPGRACLRLLDPEGIRPSTGAM
jgi:plasmid stabilization system protein ParE